MAPPKFYSTSGTKRRIQDLDATPQDSTQPSKTTKSKYEQRKTNEDLIDRAISARAAARLNPLLCPIYNPLIRSLDWGFSAGNQPNLYPSGPLTPAGMPGLMSGPNASERRMDSALPLKDRLQSFLPAMAAANRELGKGEGKGKGKMAVEIVKEDGSEEGDDGTSVEEDPDASEWGGIDGEEDENGGSDGGKAVEGEEEREADERPHVEMTLGLGVLEEKRGGAEQDEDGRVNLEVKGDEKEEEDDVVKVLTNKGKQREVGIEVLESGEN